MKPLLRGAQGPLLLAIRRRLADDDEYGRLTGVSTRELPQMIVESAEISDWTSATFVGQQHRLAVRLVTDAAVPQAACDRIARLAVPESIELARHIVVELGCGAFVITAGQGISFVVTATTLDD